MDGKTRDNKAISMRRALSVGAELGAWNSNVTGKVRLDSDATFSYGNHYIALLP